MNILKKCYDDVAYYGDLAWGISRYHLMPYWSMNFNASRITSNIYISDLPSAFNKDGLKSRGITHIINMIIGIDSIYPDDFTYKNIPSRDVPSQDLTPYFDECIEFMDKAIKQHGRVLVHCSQGISRSATIVIAYFIKKHNMTYDEAYNFVKRQRGMINPNAGFVEQLKNYESTLIR